jgi:hypothetical protein
VGNKDPIRVSGAPVLAGAKQASKETNRKQVGASACTSPCSPCAPDFDRKEKRNDRLSGVASAPAYHVGRINSSLPVLRAICPRGTAAHGPDAAATTTRPLAVGLWWCDCQACEGPRRPPKHSRHGRASVACRLEAEL